MTKEELEFTVQFLENGGFSYYAGKIQELQDAALTLLRLALEFDYSNPDLYAAIKVIRGEE